MSMTEDRTTRDRLTTTLVTAPWSMVPEQAIDLCAWLCGLPDGLLTSLDRLTAGEIASCAERIHNCTNPEGLKAEYVTARAAQLAQTRTASEEGAAWLF